MTKTLGSVGNRGRNALRWKLLKAERLSAAKVSRVRPTEPKPELDWF